MSARDELIGIAQLVLGWTILAVATWLIGRFYGFPVFYADAESDIAAAADDVDDNVGISGLLPPHPGFSMPSSFVRGGRPSMSGLGRRSVRTNEDGDDFVKLWTAAELVFFLLLATLACLLFYCCRHHRHRSKTWLFHLIVDPTFVTLAGVPLLLMDGLPRLSTLRRCLMSIESLALRQPQLNSPGSPMTAVQASSAGVHSVTSEFDFLEECLSLTSFVVFNASLSNDVRRQVMTAYHDRKYSSISDWLGILEAAIALPIVLRLIRRRYKMSWTSLLHSEFYLVVQGLDLAGLMSLAIETVTGGDAQYEGQRRAVRLSAEVAVYLAAVYLCVCCMALATPPIYVGGSRTTQRYLSFLMLSGTFVQDVPFLAIRLWATGVAYSESNSVASRRIGITGLRGGCLFYVLLIKSICAVIAAIVAVSMKPKTRRRTENGPVSAGDDRDVLDGDGCDGDVSSPATASRGLIRRVTGGTGLVTTSVAFDRHRGTSGGQQLLIEDFLDDDTDEHFV